MLTTKTNGGVRDGVWFGFDENFDSKYKIGKELGRGQFGTTYAGYRVGEMDRPPSLAIKIIRKRALTSREVS